MSILDPTQLTLMRAISGATLVVDKTVPAAEVLQLEKAIEGAAGIDKKRGDTLTVSRIAFAQPPVAAPPAGPGIADYAKYGLLGLAGVAFLVFAARHLRRKQDEVLAEPIWLKELNAPTSPAELEVQRQGEWDEEPTVVSGADEVAAMDSDQVAQQLRAWMKEAPNELVALERPSEAVSLGGGLRGRPGGRAGRGERGGADAGAAARLDEAGAAAAWCGRGRATVALSRRGSASLCVHPGSSTASLRSASQSLGNKGEVAL